MTKEPSEKAESVKEEKRVPLELTEDEPVILNLNRRIDQLEIEL